MRVRASHYLLRKMERFWRTLRQGVLDHLERSLTLSEVQQRLDTFLSRHYHSQPHSSLFGDSLREAARRKRKLVDSDIARSVLDRQVSSS